MKATNTLKKMELLKKEVEILDRKLNKMSIDIKYKNIWDTTFKKYYAKKQVLKRMVLDYYKCD